MRFLLNSNILVLKPNFIHFITVDSNCRYPNPLVFYSLIYRLDPQLTGAESFSAILYMQHEAYQLREKIKQNCNERAKIKSLKIKYTFNLSSIRTCCTFLADCIDSLDVLYTSLRIICYYN